MKKIIKLIKFTYFLIKNFKYINNYELYFDDNIFLLNQKSKSSIYLENNQPVYSLNPIDLDDNFLISYKRAIKRNSWKNSNIWRTYIACCAASNSLNLEGDFVECGVNTGGMAEAIISYLNFKNIKKNFYLIDTYEGIPPKSINNDEIKAGINTKHYKNVYNEVKNHFSKYSNVKIVKGEVPFVLNNLNIDNIAYLSIDMNVPNVDIKTAEYFWGKIVSGGIILLDDYCYSSKYTLNKKNFDEFAKRHSIKIYQIPTVQGILMKIPLSWSKKIIMIIYEN